MVERLPARWRPWPFGRKLARNAGAGKPRWRRDDMTVAALGVTLGLTCALFPWYIFFNPEKFGPPKVELGAGQGGGTGTAGRAEGDALAHNVDDRLLLGVRALIAHGTSCVLRSGRFGGHIVAPIAGQRAVYGRGGA